MSLFVARLRETALHVKVIDIRDWVPGPPGVETPVESYIREALGRPQHYEGSGTGMDTEAPWEHTPEPDASPSMPMSQGNEEFDYVMITGDYTKTNATKPVPGAEFFAHRFVEHLGELLPGAPKVHVRWAVAAEPYVGATVDASGDIVLDPSKIANPKDIAHVLVDAIVALWRARNKEAYQRAEPNIDAAQQRALEEAARDTLPSQAAPSPAQAAAMPSKAPATSSKAAALAVQAASIPVRAAALAVQAAAVPVQAAAMAVQAAAAPAPAAAEPEEADAPEPESPAPRRIEIQLPGGRLGLTYKDGTDPVADGRAQSAVEMIRSVGDRIPEVRALGISVAWVNGGLSTAHRDAWVTPGASSTVHIAKETVLTDKETRVVLSIAMAHLLSYHEWSRGTRTDPYDPAIDSEPFKRYYSWIMNDMPVATVRDMTVQITLERPPGPRLSDDNVEIAKKWANNVADFLLAHVPGSTRPALLWGKHTSRKYDAMVSFDENKIRIMVPRMDHIGRAIALVVEGVARMVAFNEGEADLTAPLGPKYKDYNERARAAVLADLTLRGGPPIAAEVVDYLSHLWYGRAHQPAAVPRASSESSESSEEDVEDSGLEKGGEVPPALPARTATARLIKANKLTPAAESEEEEEGGPADRAHMLGVYQKLLDKFWPGMAVPLEFSSKTAETHYRVGAVVKIKGQVKIRVNKRLLGVRDWGIFADVAVHLLCHVVAQNDIAKAARKKSEDERKSMHLEAFQRAAATVNDDTTEHVSVIRTFFVEREFIDDGDFRRIFGNGMSNRCWHCENWMPAPTYEPVYDTAPSDSDLEMSEGSGEGSGEDGSGTASAIFEQTAAAASSQFARASDEFAHTTEG